MKFQSWQNKKEQVNNSDETNKEALKRRQNCQYEREEAHKVGKVLCPFCDYTGLMQALCKETGYSFAFRCTHCSAAEKMGYKETFIGWNHDFASKYDVIRLG